jgi:hypothetical protein
MMTILQTKKCEACGNIFGKGYYESQRYWLTKKFCSRVCSLKVTSIKVQPNRYSIPVGSAPWNKGIKYGAELKARLNLSGLSLGHGLAAGKRLPHLSGENSGRWVKPKGVVCFFCDKTILLKPWQIKNHKRFFCNRDCWAQGTRGNGSPVYKGDKAVKDLKSRIMLLPEYASWRKSVMERDLFTCQKCGQRGGNLQVHHHRLYFFQLVNRYGFKTPEEARGCRALWDKSNGMTLCRKCHLTSHTYKDKS